MEKSIMNKRIDALDYIRGFALLGIILVNILSLLEINQPDPNTIDASYQRFLYLFVEGHFYSIFSFLFGVGFYIFLTRENEKGKKGYVLILRRLVLLLIFGAVHQLFQPGEALWYYAICGFIVMPFYKVNKHINLVLSIILIIVLGLMGGKLFLTLPLILLGLACGQYKVFENLSQKTKQIAVFTTIMFLLSIVGLIFQYWVFYAEDGPKQPIFLQMVVTVGPILSAFYVGLLLMLLKTKMVQKIFFPLKYYGRMALTNYLGQTAFILLTGKLVFNTSANITYMQSLYVCLAIYVIQIIFSVVWLRLFKMGPFEWIWRIFTYWKVVSLLNKKKNIVESQKKIGG